MSNDASTVFSILCMVYRFAGFFDVHSTAHVGLTAMVMLV